ncbi:MAG: diacylglycerol kinase family protein [Patescibacteria group bacterium]
MYYYVYDDFVQGQKYEREMALVETRLTDLEIAGKIARLALFRDPKESIHEAIQAGAKTIIAVGNDQTLRHVIDAVSDAEVVIGIIPMTKENNMIAEILGIPLGVAACDVISQRMVSSLDIGVVSGHRFLYSALIQTSPEMKIICEDHFTLFPPKKSVVEVRNMTFADKVTRAANPTDGKIEIVIRNEGRSIFGHKSLATLVPLKQAVISTGGTTVDLTVDGELFEGEEFHVSVLPSRMKVITGKERKF